MLEIARHLIHRTLDIDAPALVNIVEVTNDTIKVSSMIKESFLHSFSSSGKMFQMQMSTEQWSTSPWAAISELSTQIGAVLNYILCFQLSFL